MVARKTVGAGRGQVHDALIVAKGSSASPAAAEAVDKTGESGDSTAKSDGETRSELDDERIRPHAATAEPSSVSAFTS